MYSAFILINDAIAYDAESFMKHTTGMHMYNMFIYPPSKTATISTKQEIKKNSSTKYFPDD
ncbi:hypothetical protein DERF_014727 [Dermatophagoides farinae]|uniref:Uncharacterized protein n=1 Tax=Dermatophagoides farinae TaxID=6954 RepID=A0A922HNF9_DERFA|nr:hypothetical protein DERF_014727 [Dermatophagoides farinae]